MAALRFTRGWGFAFAVFYFLIAAMAQAAGAIPAAFVLMAIAALFAMGAILAAERPSITRILFWIGIVLGFPLALLMVGPVRRIDVYERTLPKVEGPHLARLVLRGEDHLRTWAFTPEDLRQRLIGDGFRPDQIGRALDLEPADGVCPACGGTSLVRYRLVARPTTFCPRDGTAVVPPDYREPWSPLVIR